MSDLLKKVQSSFEEKTKSKITKLSKDLGAMTDLEGDLAKLSDNLQKSASSLRQVSKDHANSSLMQQTSIRILRRQWMD